MRKFKNLIIIFLAVVFILPTVVCAVMNDPPGDPGERPEDKPGEISQPPPGRNISASDVVHEGNTVFASDTTEDNKEYSSSTESQNALLISGGTSTIKNCTVTKSGDSSGDDSDFYGTNAAIFAHNGSQLSVDRCKVTTNGSHANAIFSYGTSVINVNDTTVNTSSNNSGGIMVTGGGTLNACNLNIKTEGNSAAAIRSDRGGGKITVDGGIYETSGVGSPSIYSTADIKVNGAKLISNASEGVVVEGANSVNLNSVILNDKNDKLNGNSETYKNIFLYQSMSGDADKGKASFTSKNSEINTEKGDTIFVTNTTAEISLENNIIKNTDGDFLRIQKGKWGNSGSNGGNVSLFMSNQEVEGDIIVDDISVLNLSMQGGSIFTGAINTENTAQKMDITLSKDSIICLTADTYLSSLDNELSDNSNIYLNDHKLYVDGVLVSANEGNYDGSLSNDFNNVERDMKIKDYKVYICCAAAVLVVIGVAVGITFVKQKGKK